MSHNLAHQYSSPIINQNQAVDALVKAGSGAYVQEFHLPADIRRGTETSEIRYPELSGLQMMVEVPVGTAETVSFDYAIQYQVFGLGWVTAASGTAVGAPTDGQVWMTALFDPVIELNGDKVEGRWRIQFGNGTVTRFYVTKPNPLAFPHFDYAYDGVTQITDAAFNFRLLALTAEEGIDFLGNQYRSVVSRSVAQNVSTAAGSDPDAYWLSKPNPSKFAIENLYFDVRKQGSTTYGRRNLVVNPSFEVGFNDWTDNYYGDIGEIVLTDEWSTFGNKSALWDATTPAGISFPGIQSVNIPVKGGRTYSARADVRMDTLPADSDGITGLMRFWDGIGNAIGDSGSGFRAGLGSGEIIFTGVAPVAAVSATIIIFTYSGAPSPARFFIDAVCMIEGPTSELTYFDGDMEGYVWSGTAHDSDSFELVPAPPEDISTVVDRVLVDPITPGAHFTVYYTEEGEPGTNEDEWDDKLWLRIPQTYRMERRETHVFPEPIRAKYLKIEFSHLQARYYAPGDFQQPIRYKKHPKWVLDYFLARMQTDAAFMAERVRVVYDAIDLAYSYYLDDLGQEPQTTIDANNTVAFQLTNFLRDRQDVSDRIDPATLDKVNLVLEPYRNHPAMRGTPATLLGEYARQTVDPLADYAIEGRRASSPASADVSTLNRDRVVLEQNYPVMFFYLTCRHKYRELEAKFTHDRAYFVGVRQVAFLRDNYMTAFDTGTYIEPAADTLNIERNEFV